jgi:hypothetical protein
MAGVLAARSVPAAGVAALGSHHEGLAHHNSDTTTDAIVLNWENVTPHPGGKFSATLQIQSSPLSLKGAGANVVKTPVTDVPITGKITAGGKVTFSGKVSLGSTSLTIKDGKGQLSSLGHYVLGTLTVQNKNFSETISGKYTFDIVTDILARVEPCPSLRFPKASEPPSPS